MLYDDETQGFVQMRTKKGGGTRKISAYKEWKKTELIEEAIRLFFPNGKNGQGSVTEFEVDLMDFGEHSLDDDSTVGELYEATKFTIMRFYLTTKKRGGNSCVEMREEPHFIDLTQENLQDVAASSSYSIQPDQPLAESSQCSNMLEGINVESAGSSDFGSIISLTFMSQMISM